MACTQWTAVAYTTDYTAGFQPNNKGSRPFQQFADVDDDEKVKSSHLTTRQFITLSTSCYVIHQVAGLS